MNISLFDFTWRAPHPAQAAALTLAEAHPGELPAKETALCIYTAEQSEWMRSIRWFLSSYDPGQLDSEIWELLQRMGSLLILMIDASWNDHTGWWRIDSTQKDELRALLESNKVFYSFLPQYFNQFTRTGLDLIHHLLEDSLP